MSLSFLNVTFRSSGFSSDKMASSILASNFPESEKARILRAWAKDGVPLPDRIARLPPLSKGHAYPPNPEGA